MHSELSEIVNVSKVSVEEMPKSNEVVQTRSSGGKKLESDGENS